MLNGLRLLVTGASGRLGQRLALSFPSGVECVRTAQRTKLDSDPNYFVANLARPQEASALLDAVRPDAIVHCAALTNVDRCNIDPAAAFRINVQITRHLTDWIREKSSGTKFAYISTDQVYSGAGPHREELPAPINTYGLTKLWGEDLVRRLDNFLVARTNFFGLFPGAKRSFADWLIEGLNKGNTLTLFDDVLFNPLHVDQLCEVLVSLLEKNALGTLNIGSVGPGLSKADFGFRVAEKLGLDTSRLTRTNVSTANLTAPRPNDMRMSIAACESVLGCDLPTVDEGIDRLTREIGPQQHR